jgi:hypothetical protein
MFAVFSAGGMGRVGIDYHGLRFLMYARDERKRTSFGEVATIGRQGLHLPPWKVAKLLGLPSMVDLGTYCERLLKEHFGAANVDSYDNSDYESATHIWDMNKPLAPGSKKYDTIIDAGCLEHIFNVPQGFANISAMANPGAQILHMLPASGLCGHGFWQFSPELFFSLYSEANGYRDTEVFLAALADESCWFKVKKPERGLRADVVGSKEVYVLVRTRLEGSFTHANVQQSDYGFAWNKSAAEEAESGAQSALRRAAEKSDRKTAALSWAGLLAYRKVAALFRRTSLTGANPWLTRIALDK